ncbi:unnamed protein product, partial [Ixodes hexagonus]
VLRDKETHDAQFVTLCKMSKGAVKYTLQDFLHQPVSQASRLPCRVTSNATYDFGYSVGQGRGSSPCRRALRRGGTLPPMKRRVDDQSRMRVRPSPVAA